jgi:hypothetical protein
MDNPVVLDIVGDYEKISGTRVTTTRNSMVINPLMTFNFDGTVANTTFDANKFVEIDTVEEVE